MGKITKSELQEQNSQLLGIIKRQSTKNLKLEDENDKLEGQIILTLIIWIFVIVLAISYLISILT